MEQLWRPDTCGCAIIYNENGLSITKLYNGIAYPIRCAIHAHVSDADLYNTILDENKEKNAALNAAIAENPDAQFSWSFDGDRNVIITQVS